MVVDPDTDLVVRVGRGDRTAAQALMARHLPGMLALARRMLSGQAEAEDCVQEAFLKVWTHAARWQPGKAKFETWLYRVTLNQCYDRLRKKPTEPLEAAADVPDGGDSPDRGLEVAALETEVSAALADLPERQRAAILLCHYQERGNIEAAEILGISVEALESLLARGRRTLRTKLSHLRDGAV
ncbi:RNA polymerase sigma factor [Rhizomicrobium electricum]|jgi:RNA polymerase sigma-70 factor (ECF subfamily)|uniref:RNA polymerase sigma factor n=1 Tax=Rhizomicrobium electricum TaxID=480070 RepID=A0ABP3QDB6_9PROT|nr:RNA polymerase sigma factor [Rhizomicrobium electricum]NIJ50616.1 RNA polymerase sigma-70 factor (ECF subfamily) [Rhizomicrobium electricum]